MTAAVSETNISLWSLFWYFLKVGSYSFGGYMALVAVVEKELVQSKKIISSEDVLDGLTLASFLPGPVAVNTVVYIGHLLLGVKGAIVSMIGVLLPTFLLVTGFSYLYFQQGISHVLDPYVSFIMPVIVAIIVDVGISMSGKQIKSLSQALIALGTVIISIFWTGAWAIFISLLLAGVLGFILYRKENVNNGNQQQTSKHFLPVIRSIALAIFLTIVLLAILSFATGSDPSLIGKLASVFAGMSLTLFGGGYVIIPIIEQVMVNDLVWLNLSEFNAAISISQITPGPILISAAFIGYKMAGITGAVVGTICIFFPTGMLMILMSSVHARIKNSNSLQAILKGLKSAVIGLIVVAAFSIGSKEVDDWLSLSILMVSLGFFLFTKVHPAFILIATLLLGIIIL